MDIVKVTKAKGKVCATHPELEGLRYTSNRACVKCLKLRSYAQIKRNAKRKHDLLAVKVLEVYGSCCKDCGIDDPDVLTIDHENNDGAAHRKEIGTGGHALRRWLRRNNWPLGFATRCFNCNIKRYRVALRAQRVVP